MNDGVKLNAILTSFGTEVPPVVTSADFNMDIKSMKHEIWVRNATNAPIIITMYHYTYKKDTDTLAASPSILFNLIGAAWENGLLAQGSPANTLTNVGVTPFEASDVTTYYKIWKVKRIKLPVGGSRKYVRRQKNISINIRKFSSATTMGIAGLTHGVLFVYHGDVTTLNGGTGVGQFGTARLSFIHKTTTVLRNTQDQLSDKKKTFIIGPMTVTASAVTDYAITNAMPVLNIP